LAQKWIFCLISLLGHIVLVTELIARLGTWSEFVLIQV
jgi:hypothetical protein